MDTEKISLLIIAGGKSSRLGQDKRFVEVGGVTLLENILSKSITQNFSEIFLCVEEILPSIKFLVEKYGVKISVDEVQGAGPIAALSTALKKVSTDWAMAISIDMPFFKFESLLPIRFSETCAIVPIVNEKFQPLAAFYQKSMSEIFSQELSSGQRKLINAIKKVPHRLLELQDDINFFNVNTRADLRLARGRSENLSRNIPIISIVAPSSNTGKTTFIEKNLRNLALKIGVVKSTHHKISDENTSKDSFRFREAGAEKVYVGEDFFDELKNMDDVDLILTESRTKKFFPAISLWRGEGELIADENVAAIFTSDPQNSAAVYQFDINDTESAIKICKFLAEK